MLSLFELFVAKVIVCTVCASIFVDIEAAQSFKKKNNSLARINRTGILAESGVTPLPKAKQRY